MINKSLADALMRTARRPGGSPTEAMDPTDMLSKFGWSLVALIDQLQEAENELRHELAQNPNAAAPKIMAGIGSLSRSELALRIANDMSQHLHLKSARIQVGRLMKMMFLQEPLADFVSELRQLGMRLRDDLREADMLFVPADLAVIWNKDDHFGLGEHFKDAQQDIKDAGNCLAVGQATACVFHLMRAMELAVRKLSRRLTIRVAPQSTWGQMTTAMDHKIQAMPQNTPTQKRKKNDWQAARANLHQVGSVWRNNTMHPVTSYTPAEAIEIFNAVRVFMIALTKL